MEDNVSTDTARTPGTITVREIPISRINSYLLKNNIRIRSNPCISPDFCLDWTTLKDKVVQNDSIHCWDKSRFETKEGSWILVEDPRSGDHAWRLTGSGAASALLILEFGSILSPNESIFPATFQNLLRLKEIVQRSDPASTIFPTAAGNLSSSTLGVGARFTTLHWPAVEWAMSQLNIGVTANQNSIPRELVFDVEAMLDGKLDTVPFPFIGAAVPEGHQGQSVEGMSHGCILSKLKFGFHLKRIPWSFNADHQPIGGKFDSREDVLVSGCILASYITFDLSPELSQTKLPTDPARWVAEHIPDTVLKDLLAHLKKNNIAVDHSKLNDLLALVWPAIAKMKLRDEKYTERRHGLFTTVQGRRYIRELSIDELPGLTTPDTTAVMLALCESLGMHVDFIAPAFGFQKNLPYKDNDQLRSMVTAQWEICRKFGTSIGFHSGSGKSAENYQVMGEVTGGRLEIKTSGRYTYEMGRALFVSTDPVDQLLWHDWYQFTLDMAVRGAFSADETERSVARGFIMASINEGKGITSEPLFDSPQNCRAALEHLAESPEHMFWFEYNFLFVLAAEGKADKSALGDHSPKGYQQRERFYSISTTAKLNYLKNVASYLVFLADHTGLVSRELCRSAEKKLTSFHSLDQFLLDIAN